MYPNRNKRLITKAELFCHQDSLSGRVPVWFAMTLTVLILIFSGITYRVLAFRITDTSINLPVPLDKFPLVIGDWEGSELSIPTITREYMEKNFADDYMSRRYINNRLKTWADVYIVYCSSRPGGMLGHQPTVCYPGNGWVHDSTDEGFPNRNL